MDSLSIISSTAGLLGAAYVAYKHVKPSAIDDNSETFKIRTLAGSKEADLDIVFVHGLGTNSYSAWVGTGDNGRNHCWPVDSLPKNLSDTCSARILAYDYDTTYWTPEYLTERTLLAQTSHLIHSLASFEHRNLGRPRPIIFVAHGLGGIVVKNALVLAATSGESRLHHVVARTVGLVFLGTPHDGCPWAIARNICGMVRSLGIDLKKGEYQDLLERSTTLAYGLERFKPLARDWSVHTFAQVRPRQGQDNSKGGIREDGSRSSTGSTSTTEWGGIETLGSSVSKHKRYCTDCDDATLGRFGGADNRDLQKIMDSVRSICFEVKSRKLRFSERTLRWKTAGLNPVENLSWRKSRCNLGSMLPRMHALAPTDVSNRVVEQLLSYFVDSPVSGEILSSGAVGSHSWWSVSTIEGHLKKVDPYIGKWLLSRPRLNPVSDSSRQSYWPVVILSGPQGSGKTRTALHYAHTSEQEKKGYGSKLWVDATDRQSLETSFVGIARRIRQQYTEKDADSVDQLLGLDDLLDKQYLDDKDLQTLVGTVTDWLEGTDGERWLLIIDNLSLDSPYPPRKSFAHRLVWKAASSEIKKNSAESAATWRNSTRAAVSEWTRDGTATKPAAPMPQTSERQAWRWKYWRQLIRLIPCVTGAKGHIIITTRDTPNIPGPRLFRMEDTTSDDPLASISAATPSDAEVARVCERQHEYPVARLLYKSEIHNLGQGTAQWDGSWDGSENVRLSLQLDCARTYQAEGRFTEAGAEYENILRQKFVEHEPEKKLSTIRQLAIVRAEQGRMDEAIEQATHGLDLEDPLGGDVDNSQVLELIYELSRYLFTAGNPQAASSMLERLVMSLEHVHGRVHPTVLTARDALAQALMSTGNMEPASQQLEWLCKCRSQLHGDDHPVTLLSRARLGLLLNRRGLVDDALDTLTRCLTAAERTLAASHPLVFRVRENLYWVLRTQGKDKLAQVQLEELRREVTDHAGLYSTWIKSTYGERMSWRDSVTNAAWMNRSRSTWVLDQGEDETDDELDF